MFLTDSHCHLNAAEFESDRDAVLERARFAGVRRFVVVGCDLASSILAVELAAQNENMKASIGFHPDSAPEWNSNSKSRLLSLAQRHCNCIAAWGETGLDFLRSEFPREIQIQAFDEQAQTARELNLPLIVHCRDVYGEVLDILERRNVNKGVLHCFTGSADEALRAVRLGLMIGAGGIATFKKSEPLRQTLKQIPLESILLETDCPYLAPEGRRGKRNEPLFLAATAQILAPVFGISPEDLARITSENARRLFKFD